jgi:hypothetical protein
MSDARSVAIRGGSSWLWGNVAVTQAFLTLSEAIESATPTLLANEGRVREEDDGEVIRYQSI